MLARLIYLPCYPEMPEREIRRMADVLKEACATQSSTFIVQGSKLSDWAANYDRIHD